MIMVSWDFSIVSALVCGVVVLFWFVLLVCFREVVDAGGGFCGLSLVGGLVDRLCVGGDGVLVCV